METEDLQVDATRTWIQALLANVYRDILDEIAIVVLLDMRKVAIILSSVDLPVIFFINCIHLSKLTV